MKISAYNTSYSTNFLQNTKHSLKTRMGSALCAGLYGLSVGIDSFTPQASFNLEQKKPIYPDFMLTEEKETTPNFNDITIIHPQTHKKIVFEDIKKESEEEKPLTQQAIDLATSFEGMAEEEIEEIIDENLPDGQWCAAFQKYILSQVLPKLPQWYLDVCNKCNDVYILAQENGLEIDKNEAQPGDIALVSSDLSKGATHMGMVLGINEDGTVETIEGNTTSPDREEYCVARKNRNVGQEKHNIIGFIRLLDDNLV